MRHALMLVLLLSAAPACWAQWHQLYGYAEIPLLDEGGSQIVDPRNGQPLFTHVCFVTISSAYNGVMEVPVHGYQSAITHYAVHQDIRNRRAEVREVDQLKFGLTNSGLQHYEGTFHF